MTPIPDLSGKTVAIVAMGKSHDQFIMAKTHSQQIDEVWAVNAMAGVILHDRVFMMDPASRFLDGEDAGTQTGIMRAVLAAHPGPIYTCELDETLPGPSGIPAGRSCKQARNVVHEQYRGVCYCFCDCSKRRKTAHLWG